MNGSRDIMSKNGTVPNINEIKSFFECNSKRQFNLKSLNAWFPNCDMYSDLLKLEKSGILIRCRININEKPVTHWQLKEMPITSTVLSKNFESENSSINMSNRSHQNNLNKPKISSSCQSSSSDKTDNSNNASHILVNQNEKCRLPPRRLISTNVVKNIDNHSQKSHETILTPQIKKYAQQEYGQLSKEFIAAVKQNPVSVLYEFAQHKGMYCQIDAIEVSGPSHKPKITMVAILDGRKFDSTTAPNKKEGKRLAADVAIKQLISEGHITELISKHLTRAALKKNANKNDKEKESSMSVPILQKIASLIHLKLNNFLRNLSAEKSTMLAGRNIFAGIVMQDEKHDTLQIVALATGNNCISGEKISLHGKVVNDCHAEVIVRRSFMLFLYQQLSAHVSSSDESLDIFEELSQENCSLSVLRRFKLKSHVKFHLYISTAPCGDGALFCHKGNCTKKSDSELVHSMQHAPILKHPVQGLLRSKMEGGDATIPVMNVNKTYQVQSLDAIMRGEKLKTMSCSDKIARWNYLGVQGALLNQFLEPIFLASISVGQLYEPGHLCRALCCRLEENMSRKVNCCSSVVNHPDIGYVHVEGLQHESDKCNEFSINWSYGLELEIVDGVTGQLTGPEKSLVCSRITKASLFHQYLKLFRSAGYNPFVNRYSYAEAKLLSQEYEIMKERLFEMFHKLEYGSWIRKPTEQNNFRDTLYN